MTTSTNEEAGNLDVVRRAFNAFQTGDAETLMKSLAPNVRYRSAPAGKFTGDYQGLPAVMGFFGQLAQESEGTFQVTLVDTAASGDRVYALHTVTGRRNEKSLDLTSVLVLTLADGLVTEILSCPNNHPAEVIFWA